MAVIKLVGPAYTSEGLLAVFSVALDSNPLTTPLAIGGSVTFTLDTSGASATEGVDFASLIATDLKSSDPSKISLGSISTDATTGRVTVTATNISGSILARGTSLLTFALATKPDLSSAESTELYNVQLTSTSDTVSGTGVVSTRIETSNGAILNWGRSVGNRTIDTSGVFLVPEQEFERFANGISADAIVAGGRYQIQSLGTTDFIALGAGTNTIGTIFTATDSGSGTGRAGQFLPSNLAGKNDYGLGFLYTVDPTSGDGTFTLDENLLKIPSGYTTYPTVTDNAGSFSVGSRYTIASTGGTNFTLVGAANNNPGTVFIATGTGTGSGTAVRNRNDITIGAGELEIGRNYTISTAGTTDFTTVGATNSLPGTSFIATGTGSGTGSAITVNENNYLYAIGYPPKLLPNDIYINALELTTLRLGNGNDFFGVIGTGIVQSVRADVSIDSSKGYIFQSSIFAGSGDDTLRVLMPWQSIFKGGSNTTYYDAVNGTDPGNGIGVTLTLNNALTVEEVPYGDLIELKGSRFDWDIEFKDGDGKDGVTLESILDERDYLAVANNNQISGFERILFGDILFDLVLYRQQQSSVVYGQPEYYLNGLENLAPELNSDIASGSKLWEAFRFNRTKLQGITGTATDPTDVFTGDTNDTPFIVGALRFASLNTEAGNDIVEIGTSGQTSVDQASIDLGSGTDQLKVNGLFSRSSVKGGDDADNIILTTASNATVDGGTGNDVVEITTSVSQTVFTGGDGNDVLILPGTYASYLLTSSVTGGVITFNDGFGNSITGVETIKFSDINLDALQQLSLTGPGTIDEGIPATYTVKLFKPPIDPPVNAGALVVGNRYEILTIGTTDYTLLGAANNTIGTTFTATATGSGTGTATNIVLLAGESAAFSLQLSGSGLNPTNIFTDLAALVTSSLQASAGIVLKNISVDTTTGLIRAVATAARDLTAGTDIATLSVPVNADLLTETPETFQVTLRDFGSLVPLTQQITTNITDVPPLTIKLVGPSAAVTEGSSANYKVFLDAAGLSLAIGRSVSFTLDSASGTATEGSDFVALSAGVLTPNSTAGVTLTTSSGPNGSITVTATNNGLATLAAGGELLSFAVETNTDTLAESSENFSVTLSSSSAVISSGAAVVNATIADQVPAITIRLDPSPTTSVIEGSTASFLVSLDGTPLKAGEQVRLRLDTDSGSGANPAREGTDFAALIAAGLTPVNGISLSAISTSTNGAVTLTATNTGGFDLPNNSQLLSFNITTSNDVAVEGDETFRVTLSGLSLSAATTGADVATVTITDNDIAAIKLTGSSTVAEGGSASYAVSLDGVGLGAGQGLTFTLDSSGLSASESSDFAALLAGSLLPAAGISPSAISTAANGAITLTLTNSGTSDLAAGAQLLSFSLATTSDTLPEINETFSVSLSSSSATVTTGTVTTAITDDDPLSVSLSGPAPATVVEGASATPYTVALGAGVGLGVGRSVTFTLDSASGTATEGVDFAALLAGGITAASGLTLTPPTTGLGGVLTVTLTNNTAADLVAGADLVTFAVQTTADLFNEADETYGVTIAGGTGVSVSGAATVTTTITNDDPLSVRLSGPATVVEGASATPYTVALGAGVGLGVGRSITFTLDSASGTATEGVDFAALLAGGITAASGLTLTPPTTGAGGVLTVTLTNNTAADLAAGADLVTFAVQTTADLFNEDDETYGVTIAGGAGVSVSGAATVITTITNDDPLSVRLSGPATVVEGASATPYTVALGAGVGLGVGRSVTFTLDSASGTATEVVDFAALAGGITAASGLTLTPPTTGPGGVLTVTLTNNTGADLAAGSDLVTFAVQTTADLFNEADETYGVTIAGGAGVSVSGAATVTTMITDNDPAAIRLTGSSSVAEGATASYAIELDGVGLGAGRSIAFSLFTSKTGTATESSDFAKFLASALTPAAGVSLTGISTTTSGIVSATATNTSGADLAVNAPLLTFSLATFADAVAELAETFELNLSSLGLQAAAVSIATFTTTITDTTAPVIRLTGSPTVAEGKSARFGVSLDGGVALGAGRSLTITLDSASNSATENLDFAALVAASIKPTAANVTLSAISTDPLSQAVTLTVTNPFSFLDLAAGSELLSFELPTTADPFAEGNETFNVSLSSGNATVTTGVITTTITDANAAAIKLTGVATVAEGSPANYAVSLDGVGLGAGRSVTFTLDSASGTATEGVDFGAFVAASLQGSAGVTLSGISTASNGAVTGTATNTSGADLALGSQLLTFAVATTADSIAEGDETFNVSLASGNATVTTAAITSTITDANTAAIKLTGAATVAEGSSANYAISLDGVGIRAGGSLTFSLDSASGTATKGADFATLVAANLLPSAGISLSGISTAANGALTLTATNSGTTDLATGSQLLTFAISTTADAIVEGPETFGVNLTSSSATVNAGTLTTTILDANTAGTIGIKLGGSTTVAEGGVSNYSVSLAGAGLGAGRSVTFTLDSASGTATEGADFGAVVAASLQGSAGITLSGFSTDPISKAVTVTATNSSGSDLAVGAQLLSFSVSTVADSKAEGNESYTVSLVSNTAAVSPGSLTTTITDTNTAVIKLTSTSPLVTEGRSASYAVSLDGVVLGVGGSVTFTLDTASGTATKGSDFAALATGALTATTGVTLSAISTDPISKAVTLTATNTSSVDLAAGAQLLSFVVTTLTDSIVESSETFTVNLSSTTTKVSAPALITTVITNAPANSPQDPIATTASSTINDPAPSFTIKDPTAGAVTDSSYVAKTSTLSDLTTAVTLKTDASKFLDLYKINNPTTTTPKAASSLDVSFIDFTLKTGSLKSITAEITLDKEVKANAYVKVNPNTGEAFDFTYDPITGLGAELIDNNKNGLVDSLRIHLQDGAKGDVDGLINGEIRDPGVLADAPRQSVYRFFKAEKGVHLYTSSEAERANVNAHPEWGYKDEGVAYQALVTQGKALHRFFNAKASYHFMTTNDDESKKVIANPEWGFTYEGTSFSVSTIPQLGMSTPINRFYRVLDGVGQHFYTASADEASNINAHPEWGYKSEGIGWYV